MRKREVRRITTTLLSFVEKPLLQWLVARLPRWVKPDLLTILGLFGSLMTGLGYYLSSSHNAYLWLASFGLFVNWFGDSLDGTLARYRKIERPRYGFYIDHAIDTITIVLIGIGAGLSPYARFDIALFALIGYLMMSILVYLNTFVSGVFRIAFYGFGPTEIRIFIVLINTIIFFHGAGKFQFRGMDITVLDAAAIFLTCVLFIFYIVSVIVDGRKLQKEEKKEQEDSRESR
ncbi:MAG: CDP-alcohol phosphatidyltransferase family protein [Candidatus Neomarinimicrobiota bacterium]|nr:CDP-alcohol phosphatidyltransferase family protein [Candidatus Neomarinimicrobiota bacterium]MDD3966621.1 CDP-alcohol phosphatidyltransferase family protein [Candidatus Neomarinimicrobiota bacterium]MDX9780346.1 CDP-alcohol phosphatidyltransferase family protein [bacterium]